MGFEDIAGLKEPLTKLVETVSNGIGVVGNNVFRFDSKKIKRIGEAEAGVERNKIIAQAEGKKEEIKILNRAYKRFALEQYNKQVNYENVIAMAKDDLEGKKVSNEPVEVDWTRKFFDIAQDISREELQILLAKILSGEIQQPGSFSLQTLEVVKYLSKKDLEMFLKFIAISTNIGVIKLKKGKDDDLKKYGLNFVNYADLSTLGLFNQSSMISYAIDLPALTSFHLDIGCDRFCISHEDAKTTKKFNFGLYVFSGTGKELRKLLIYGANNDRSEEFKNDFIDEAQKKGFKVMRQNTNRQLC